MANDWSFHTIRLILNKLKAMHFKWNGVCFHTIRLILNAI